MYYTTALLAFASSALAANFNVRVGGNQALTFTPQTVQAQAGDTVTFQFIDQNHTVTSGNPNRGCTPDGQFNSGFVPIAANANANANRNGRGRNKRDELLRGLNNIFETRQNRNSPTFTVNVQDTNPIAVYCAQAQHCQQGMVMVINPTNDGATSLAAYVQRSARANTNRLPNTPAGTGGQLQGVQAAAAGANANGNANGNGRAGGRNRNGNNANAQNGNAAAGANANANGNGRNGGARASRNGANNNNNN